MYDGNAAETDGQLESFLTVDESQLFDSVNGLVCCTKSNQNIVLIFNPSTRKSIMLPVVPFDLQISFDYCFDKHLCGFGYDHVNDEYKIVKIALLYRSSILHGNNVRLQD